MTAEPYTVGSLFTGIGGIDLAFEWAGFRIDWQVEIDGFCNTILSKRWPDVRRERDVRGVTGRSGKGWRHYRRLPAVDVLVGGFPCQDISVAGKGAGIRAGARSGLWFEFARLIGELRPRLVLLENVPAITSRDGTVVLGDLAALGYDARWGVISAADAGAVHQRERWWCVAHAVRGGSGSRRAEFAGQQRRGAPEQSGVLADAQRTIGRAPSAGRCDHADANDRLHVGGEEGTGRLEGGGQALADAAIARLSQRGCTGQPTGAQEAGRGVEPESERCSEVADTSGAGLEIGPSVRRNNGAEQPPAERGGESVVNAECGGLGGVARGRSGAQSENGRTRRNGRPVESGVGRAAARLPVGVDGCFRRLHVARPGQPQHEWEPPRVTSGQPHRVARLKALGNAVVPPVVYPIAVMMREWLDSAGESQEARA